MNMMKLNTIFNENYKTTTPTFWINYEVIPETNALLYLLDLSSIYQCFHQTYNIRISLSDSPRRDPFHDNSMITLNQKWCLDRAWHLHPRIRTAHTRYHTVHIFQIYQGAYSFIVTINNLFSNKKTMLNPNFHLHLFPFFSKKPR